jgi:hypothetical protein
MDSPPTSTPPTSTPIKRKRGEQTELQLDKASNIINEGSFLFRSSSNSADGYSRDGAGLHYFLPSTSGLDAYKPQEHECRWFFWQYRVEEELNIINIPEYSEINPLTVPPECILYFGVKTEGTTRVERILPSDNHQLDNIFYTSVFEQIRHKFPNSIFGLSMPGNGIMHEEVVLDSVENLTPIRLQCFSNEPRKRKKNTTSSTNSTTSSTNSTTSSTFIRKINFNKKSLFKQFVI